jgi:hypothetical protein
VFGIIVTSNQEPITQDGEQRFDIVRGRAIEIVPAGDLEGDETNVEVLDQSMMAIRQLAEDGTMHTICLSPEAALRLVSAVSGYIYFPEGFCFNDDPDRG